MLIEIPASDTPEQAAAKFAQQPEVVILLFGSFDAALSPQVQSLLARALIPVALLTHAAIVDNGSSEGIATLMGQAAQQVDLAPLLLGILPANTPGPDPNHADVMHLPAEWTDPAKAAFLITAALARDKTMDQKPVIGVLAGGGDNEKLMALRCARRNWPLLLVQGAGGVADALVAATTPPPAGAQAAPLADPVMQEIVDTGDILSFSLADSADSIKRALLGPIQKPRDVLADAWSRYDDLDRAAIGKQNLFRWTQGWVLLLTVFATLVAIVTTRTWKWIPTSADLRWIGTFNPLHVLMLIIPIVISILVGFNARFREGNKWILLRAASEAMKREIFRYRTRSGAYSAAKSRQVLASSTLAANIKDITGNLIQSEVNRSSLPELKAEDAKNESPAVQLIRAKKEAEQKARLQFLTPSQYLAERIDDQIHYFEKKTRKLYWQMKLLNAFILVIGGLGTFLAAVHKEVWVALTTALATAITNKLEIDQTENSLVQYNMALTALRNIETWWKGLSPWEMTRQANVDLLVDQTETSLAHETAGWVQQMQSTLDKLTERQSGSNQNADAAANQAAPAQ
ncbi:MAG TPA: DUF4231 domain-containing protein [Acidobacteriaceae bacterium]